MPSSAATEELIDVMDANSSGDVSLAEVLTGIGMLRRELLEMIELQAAFHKMAATDDWGTGGTVALSAKTLSLFLQVPLSTAEE